jgi:osmotically-inducible protein OsmY
MRLILTILVGLFALLLLGCDVVQSTRIEQAVVKALKDDARTAEYDFEVSYQGDGQVLITGTIFQPEESDFVQEIALSVEGVDKVLNRTHVEEHGSGLMQDEVVNTPFL